MPENNTRVVWTTIDGCHAETFYSLYRAGKLPNTRRAMGDEPLFVERATTCFPSVTVVCLAALATGCWFKNTGLMSNVFYDRSWTPFEGRAYLSELEQTVASYDRGIIGWPTILLPELNRGGLVNADINPDIKTIYEVLADAGMKSHSMFSYVGRGATIWRRPNRREMLAFAKIDKLSHDYAHFDKLMMDAAIQLGNKHGIPDLVNLYFAGNDGNSHLNGVGTQAAYLQNAVDPQLGRYIDFLEKSGGGRDTYFIISADHGQTGFPRGGEHKFIWTEQIEAMLRDAGPGTFVDGGEKSKIDPAANVVYSIGTGASNGIYIRNRATGDWLDSPRYREDTLAVAHAIIRASDHRMADRPAYIGPFLDFIVLREAIGKPYFIYQTDYPYKNTGKLIPLEEYFAGKEDLYPDAVAQIRGLEHPHRGPDLIYVINYDRGGYYFAGGDHLGNHGSLSPEDIFIPLMFSGPGIRKDALPRGRAIDIAPTIASLFGLEMPTADGIALPVKG